MPINKKAAPLRPLPMRVTPRQYERLTAARDNDGYSVQDHVRRALDMYLDLLDRRARNLPGDVIGEALTASTPPPVAKAPPSAVVSRVRPKVIQR